MDALEAMDKPMSVVHRLQAMLDETLVYFDLDDQDLARRYGPDKWTVAYVLHHLADVEAMELERVHRILTESRPTVQTIDADVWARELGYDRRPIAPSRALFAAGRAAVIQYATMFLESRGEAQFVHSQHGPMTLRQQFEKIASHNAKHVGHIRAALRRS